MRQNYSFSKNSNALLEPCEGKLSCTVLRGESPSNGADLLDTKLIYAIGAVVGLIGGVKVYGKFSSGDPDTSKTAASWFGACIFLIVAATASAFAQGNGIAGITEATSMVTSYFDPGTKLIYAIGAVVGLIGGVKVYGKFSSGDPDTSKTAASWFGACIFLIVAATILRSFFL